VGKESEKEADSEELLYRVLTSAPVELQLGTDWARAGARRAQRSSTKRARGAACRRGERGVRACSFLKGEVLGIWDLVSRCFGRGH
jgi:hypothetical protein